MSEDEAALTAEEEAAVHLLTARAVRERTAELFAVVEDGRSDHFTFVPDALPAIADRVADLTRERFPDLSVPLHSRWRHFEVGGVGRFREIASVRGWSSPEDAARAMGDLAIVSVLLDAGAGPTRRYQETATGGVAGRSEGLALASFAMFIAGSFSGVPADPLRADAAALASLSMDEFARGFQIRPDNPLEGAQGRLELLQRLADATRSEVELFASLDDPRPGGLVDALAGLAENGNLPAAEILHAVLEGLGPIWPSRLELGGIPLGDAWRHPALAGDAPGSDIVPFHKLSTWLSLSLIEPLAVRGVNVVELDGLPGLAEYRNGGLFVDGGALALKHGGGPYTADDPLIVEWRAATVVLLDRIAPMVRERLGVGAQAMPLAAILEGGTWLAGRLLAREKRADGSPPIGIVSDGTVF